MKQYILLILLAILITSCAPEVEIDVAKPVEEIRIGEQEEIEEETEEIIEEEPEENIIEIKEDSFYPVEKTIEKNTEIKWIKKDVRNYKMACYLEGTRVIQSPDLKAGDSFKYAFLKEGKYTCITTPYGLRSSITVEAKTALLAPTGNVVGSRSVEGASLAAIAVILTIILLFFIYSRRRQ